MTIRSLLIRGTETLLFAEVDTPVLDAAVLLTEALGFSKEKLFSSLPDAVDTAACREFKKFIDMRCSGMPVSYIRKKKEFYGIEFFIDERVLVPRPDTEILVDEVLRLTDTCQGSLDFHDACTGSGCIAITIKHYRPNINISASDISDQAGQVFNINSNLVLGIRLPFYLSDLFDKVDGRFDIITCNPPYLTDSELEGMKKIDWPEPASALAGGPDGLRIIRQLIIQAKIRLKNGGRLLVEASSDQMNCIESLMNMQGMKNISSIRDLSGKERVIGGSSI